MYGHTFLFGIMQTFLLFLFPDCQIYYNVCISTKVCVLHYYMCNRLIGCYTRIVPHPCMSGGSPNSSKITYICFMTFII